jgi:hypothetical protein
MLIATLTIHDKNSQIYGGFSLNLIAECSQFANFLLVFFQTLTDTNGIK